MREDDLKEWSGILVYIECRKGVMNSVSRELIGEALRLSGMLSASVYAVAAGSCTEEIEAELLKYPLGRIYLYETMDEFHPVVYETMIAECIEELKPSIVLIGGTYEGRALAPRLAVALRSGLTADCTSLDIDEEGNLIQIRPAFGGNVMASIVTKCRRPQFATVRPGIMEPVKGEKYCSKAKNRDVIKKIPDIDSEGLEILDIEEAQRVESIADQKVLVVAGRGVRKKEDLKMLEELAYLLGGRLACSRALVEKGWMQAKDQIGLSGNTVSPDYMITCGVSGTVQFIAGMKHTKNIIAVNTDADARIFEIAHYPVPGDLYEIIPEMIEQLKTGKGDGFTET